MEWPHITITLSDDAKLIAGDNTPLLIQNVLPVVHTYNTQHPEQRVALALPDIHNIEQREDGRVQAMNGALGRIRLFGPVETLERLMKLEAVQRLVRTQMIRGLKMRSHETLDPVKHVSYHRLRRGERSTKSAVYRSERRYQRRAEERSEGRDSDIWIKRRLKNAASKQSAFHKRHKTVFIPAESRSTNGRGFSLFIEERAAEFPSEGELNSYGLSAGSMETAPFTVPAF